MLSTITDNIVNANTNGFKGSRTEFQTVLAQDMGGAALNQIGRGVQVGGVPAGEPGDDDLRRHLGGAAQHHRRAPARAAARSVGAIGAFGPRDRSRPRTQPDDEARALPDQREVPRRHRVDVIESMYSG